MAKAAVSEERKNLNGKTEDVSEMLTLLGQLTQEEKREIKGIMIGIQMSKQFGKTA
nr:MAG TPA: hypothetical protein [Caudoviricetes sp.]